MYVCADHCPGYSLSKFHCTCSGLVVDCATGATVSHDVRVCSCVYEEITELYESQTSCVHMYIHT